MDDRDPIVQINMSSIPVAGIGGIGMLALAVIIAAVFVEARRLLFIGLAGGVLFAVLLVPYGRGHKPHPRRTSRKETSGGWPLHSFRLR